MLFVHIFIHKYYQTSWIIWSFADKLFHSQLTLLSTLSLSLPCDLSLTCTCTATEHKILLPCNLSLTCTRTATEHKILLEVEDTKEGVGNEVEGKTIGEGVKAERVWWLRRLGKRRRGGCPRVQQEEGKLNDKC
jgi:hypothetical protein